MTYKPQQVQEALACDPCLEFSSERKVRSSHLSRKSYIDKKNEKGKLLQQNLQKTSNPELCRTAAKKYEDLIKQVALQKPIFHALKQR